MLASAICGRVGTWPRQLSSSSLELVIGRIKYHGIAGLLADCRGEMATWPVGITQRVRELAIAQAMWELRHQEVLSKLLTCLAESDIAALLLKGTAVAYDLYPSPSSRSRGDTDLLIAPAALVETRAILRTLGFSRDPLFDEAVADIYSQEIWSLSSVGSFEHHIDLHWKLINSTALQHVLSYAECLANPLTLPRLCPEARTMDRVRSLIHTCVHRAMHFTAPYFTDGVAFYGGDRLIWAKDIDLLANALSEAEWRSFCALAREKGVSAVCLEGLNISERFLCTDIPDFVREHLSGEPHAPASEYLLRSRRGARAWRNLRAIQGLRRKFAYARARSLPSAAFMRRKYPDMAKIPLPILYARRVLELFRPLPGRSDAR